MEIALGVIGLIVTVALAFWGRNRYAEKRARRNDERELSRLAHEVVAATVRADGLCNDLKMAYQTLFTFAGQGAGSSRLKLYTGEVEKTQSQLGPMQAAARTVLEGDVEKLNDADVAKYLREFDGNLAHLARVREKLEADLASVEAQNQTYREKVIHSQD